MKDEYLFNITQLAEAFGLHRDTIRKRLNQVGVQAVCIRKNAALYLLKEAAPAITRQLSSNESEINPDKLSPGERKAWFDSENARLNFEEACGNLCESHEVAKVFADCFKAIVNPLDSLPDLLERKANLSPEQIELVISQVDNVREEMYLSVVNSGGDIA
mgnify:CR=1 FL=1